MKKLCIADMTLGAAARFLPVAPGFKEKLEAARNLDRMGADVIEFCEIGDAKADSLLIRTACQLIKNAAVSLCAGLDEKSADIAWSAVAGAAKPRLYVSVPVSSALMEYNCHLKPPAVLALIKTTVSKCAALCREVEFRAEDATRADGDFLKAALTAAIESGATVITVCDNEGCSLPSETGEFIKGLYAGVPALSKVRLGYLCEDVYGLALPCLIAAAVSGAEEVKLAAGSARFVSPSRLADILGRRGKALSLEVSLNQTELTRILQHIGRVTSEKKNGLSAPRQSGLTDGAGEAVLTKNDNIEAVGKVIAGLGYELDGGDLERVYDAFLRVAEKKKRVTAKEMDAIVASAAAEAPPAYKLLSYAVTGSNVITASANVSLQRDGETREAVSLGDGPVDAAFLALEQITGRHFELDDFQIQSVTEGREAMGSALVKLRSGAKLYSGQGISTDIIGASIRAYLSAVNKIINEENA